jgi:release factor glutamine methyltransferase
MTLTLAQQDLRRQLEGLYDPRESANIADLVMEKVTALDRMGRLVHKLRKLGEEEQAHLQTFTAELLRGRPVQYVIGESWFAGMPFFVNEEVLIPRPETEELAEWGVDILKKSGLSSPRILDMGTGSGCLAITLKKKLPLASVMAIDKSSGAIQVASRNAQALGAAVEFHVLDFLDKDQRDPLDVFDLIISNPPYIPLRDKASMAPNVLDHEPHLALFVENDDPLLFYRALAEFGREHLVTGGSLLCEIHEDLGEQTMELFQRCGFRDVQVRRDLQGKERMVLGYRF